MVDNRHTTFFDMLGNWSLGDYYKEKQLPWFFAFLTDEVGIDPKRLYVTAFIGDEEASVPKDTESGEIRFNTTTELMEYYDGNQWKPIDAPPTISSVSTSDATGDDAVLAADGSTIFTITITGGNFGIGANVKFIGNTGTEYTAGNINRVSGSSITCTTL